MCNSYVKDRMARDGQEMVHEMLGEIYDMIAGLAWRVQALEEGLEKLQKEQNERRKSQRPYEQSEGITGLEHASVDIMLEEAQRNIVASSSRLGPTGGIGKKSLRSKKKKGGFTMTAPSTSTTAPPCSKCGRRHGKREYDCPRCFKCGKPGHIARHCFQNRLYGSSSNLIGSVTSPIVPTVLPLANQKQKDPLP